MAVVCSTGQMYTNGDGVADERDAALDRREAAVTVREVRLARRMVVAQRILAAGDQRDAVSVARDVAAETREHYLDRAQFLAHIGNDTYRKENRPKRRRAAALDRDHAKGDREASLDDRIALAEALA
jgi:hypothetical protein